MLIPHPSTAFSARWIRIGAGKIECDDIHGPARGNSQIDGCFVALLIAEEFCVSENDLACCFVIDNEKGGDEEEGGGDI